MQADTVVPCIMETVGISMTSPSVDHQYSTNANPGLSSLSVCFASLPNENLFTLSGQAALQYVIVTTTVSVYVPGDGVRWAGTRP